MDLIQYLITPLFKNHKLLFHFSDNKMFEEDVSEDIDILTADESEDIKDFKYFPFDPGENLIVILII